MTCGLLLVLACGDTTATWGSETTEESTEESTDDDGDGDACIVDGDATGSFWVGELSSGSSAALPSYTATCTIQSNTGTILLLSGCVNGPSETIEIGITTTPEAQIFVDPGTDITLRVETDAESVAAWSFNFSLHAADTLILAGLDQYGSPSAPAPLSASSTDIGCEPSDAGGCDVVVSEGIRVTWGESEVVIPDNGSGHVGELIRYLVIVDEAIGRYGCFEAVSRYRALFVLSPAG